MSRLLLFLIPLAVTLFACVQSGGDMLRDGANVIDAEADAMLLDFGGLDEFKQAFNKDTGDTRLVLLMSPT